LLSATAAPAGADESAALEAEFTARIAAAYEAADKAEKKTALLALFHLEDVDPETRAIFERTHVGRFLARYETPTVAFEPLPDDFDPLQVAGGYEYRPNLELLGTVVLREQGDEGGRNTRIPYGLHGGRYLFTAVTRTAVNPDAPPDKSLQMIVIGLAVPPPRFKGFCDVMQSNGESRRMAIEDNGHGNRTLIVMAQYLERCELTSDLSGDGALSLRLLEDDREILHQRIEAPESTLTWRR
jgi:hypothetical protein